LKTIRIITDTDSSIPSEICKEFKITQVPISIHFGGETFESGINITEKELFQRVDQEGVLPTTSAPSPGKFEKIIEAIFAEGADEVICFCVSSEVSATYSAALAASQNFPEEKVHVIDSRSLSMGQGFMVIAAAEAALHGSSSQEIVEIAESTAQRTHLYAYLPTLKYLAMSGRVGHIAAGMADIFNVKPILTIQNGKLELIEKVRTQKKAQKRIIELGKQISEGKDIERFCFVHAIALEAAKDLEKQMQGTFTLPEKIIYAELSAGLSVHSGAGMLGFAFVVSD